MRDTNPRKPKRFKKEGDTDASSSSTTTTTTTAAASVAPTPIQQSFGVLSGSMDARNDLRERVYKLSRDITKASKTVISFLQRCTSAQPGKPRDKLLAKARKDLLQVCKQINLQARQVQDRGDYFRLRRTFSGGLQEFIEALSFYQYIKDGSLISQQGVEDFLVEAAQLTHSSNSNNNSTKDSNGEGKKNRKDLSGDNNRGKGGKERINKSVTSSSTSETKTKTETKTETETETETGTRTESADKNEKENEGKSTKSDSNNSSKCAEHTKQSPTGEKTEAKTPTAGAETSIPASTGTEREGIVDAKAEPEAVLAMKVPLLDYILGVCDLTGELMRFATTSVSAGDVQAAERACVFTRDLYASLRRLDVRHREYGKKMSVMMQSLRKIELLGYKNKLRRDEYPPHILSKMMKMRQPVRGGEEDGGEGI